MRLDDGEHPPHLDEFNAMVSVGRDWLREHQPELWAHHCALRIFGVGWSITWNAWQQLCERVQAEVGFGASNETVATALVDLMLATYNNRERMHV